MNSVQAAVKKIEKEKIILRGTGKIVRLATSNAEAISAIMESLGEDPDTGTTPLYEHLLGTISGSDPAALRERLHPWSADERQRLLSRFPAEGLEAFFRKAYGNNWPAHEASVLIEDFILESAKTGIIIDGGGLNKIRALHAVLSASKDQSSFHTDARTFFAAACWLNGKSVPLEFAIPTPLEIARALHIIEDFRPEIFSDEVAAGIAAVFLDNGLWALPDIVSFAQDELLEIAESKDLTVSLKDVVEVIELVEAELKTGKAIPDLPVTLLEVQALRYIDLTNAINRENAKADSVRDAVRGVYE